ncbi:MAG: addiction module protein [Methylacidiphilales bacterium]|nr:addiction module protein [Candidatus Methylacidiphilales bacterium]
MSLTVAQLTEEALALSADARAELADRIVESLDPVNDASLRQIWVQEAFRRRDEIRTGKVETISGDEVFRQVRQALGE